MAGVFCVGGCALGPTPVALISQHGEILRDAMNDGAFTVANGKTTYTGAFNVAFLITEKVHSTAFPIHYSDGRTGIATAQQDGHGNVRFSDGTEADFIFGQGANQI